MAAAGPQTPGCGAALSLVAWVTLAVAPVPKPCSAPSASPPPCALQQLTCCALVLRLPRAHTWGRRSPSMGRRVFRARAGPRPAVWGAARTAQPGGRPFFPAGSGLYPGWFPFRMGPFAAILGNEVIFLIA